MAQIEIVPVHDSRARRLFVGFPYEFYRGDPHWVPPLRLAQKQLFDPRRHPFHRHAEMQCFLARQDGRPAGRIAAILDRNHNQFHGEQAGFFGFFETVNDPSAAGALLDAAAEWLRQRGARLMRGPMNPSTNYECGLLVDGFDSSPYVMMTYNPPYYAGLIERAGLHKTKDLYAYWMRTDALSIRRLDRALDRLETARKIRIRPLRPRAFQEDAELVWGIYNSAWERNWGFVPMTHDEFFFMAHDLKSVLEPELALIGEAEGRAVGFALALPDINRALKHANGRLFPVGLLKILYHKRSIRTLRVVLLGVLREFRTAAVAAGFYAELFRRATRLGYEGAEMSWVLEDNLLMCRSLKALGAKRYKIYRIYERNL